MRVFVTGATGALGRHLVPGLGCGSNIGSTAYFAPHLNHGSARRCPIARRCARPATQLGAWVTDETTADSISRKVVRVPLLGQLRAGNPIHAEESADGTFALPRQLVGGGALFVLKVIGDSMINAAITDGDWVVVRQQPVAENGEIVAAMIDGEATIKTLSRSNNHTWLMPHNPAYPPIFADHATILGKVVAVLRRL
jgi:SOS regulatory protein LexA